MKKVMAAIVMGTLAGCATVPNPRAAGLPAGARYVAMGSSYAAGAGIGPLVPGSPRRCGRTQNNYPHLLAARLGLDLVDVSCGGATTAHILGPWGELPAQIDAVTPDTRLVTVTIGGNDINYVRNLMLGTCGRAGGFTPPSGRPCPAAAWAAEADYRSLEQQLRLIVRGIRQRAPKATVIFVDYLRLLPATGDCAAIPLDAQQEDEARKAITRLAATTRAAAEAEGATLLPAGRLSAGHDACSARPWIVGRPGQPADWHPTAAGHAAVADALAARFGGTRPHRADPAG